MKEDGTRYAAAYVTALANNGVMDLFSNVKYELAGQEIECVNNPGIAGVLIGIAKYPCDGVWNWNDPMLVTRNIGWNSDGKGTQETEGVYHSKIRSPLLVQFYNRGSGVWHAT